MRSPTVSFLRGLAIIGVVLVHTTLRFEGMAAILRSMLSFGQMGCQIFFLLSAYCLCLSNTGKGISLFTFYKRRFLSMAPAYWSAIIIGFFIYGLAILFLGTPTMKIEPNPVYIVMNAALLHGVLPLYKPMNTIVCGGWFVGTMMVLYYLFPVMFKSYFNDVNPFWNKNRWFIFPLIVISLCWTVVIASGYDQDSYCILGSAKYFYFLNQLPSFAIGFSLFEISQRRIIKSAFVKSLLFWTLSAFFFFADFKISYIVAPVLVSVAASYLFLYLDKKRDMISGSLGSFVSDLGDTSFAIYLTHFWIVYTVAYILQHECHFLYGNMNQTLSYLLYLPIELALVYLLSRVYSRWINKLNNWFLRSK